MTKLIHRKGDIFTTNARAIGHGVNLRGVMGAGIAAQFAKRFPDMLPGYRHACESGELYLGALMSWEVPSAWGQSFYVLNIATQTDPGANADYKAVFDGVAQAVGWCGWMKFDTLALPRIGSGIGGLDEGIVESILLYHAQRTDVDIELWTYKP